MNGRVIHYQSVATWLWVFLIVVTFLLAASVAAYVKYSDRVTVEGYVRLDPDTLEILSRIDGIISKLHVSDGISVKEGIPLVEVTSISGMSGSAPSNYHRQIESMEASIRNSQARVQLLHEKIENSQHQLDESGLAYEALRDIMSRKAEMEESNVKSGEVMLEEFRSLESKHLVSQIDVYFHEMDVSNLMSKAMDSQIKLNELQKVYFGMRRNLDKAIIDSKLRILDEQENVNLLRKSIVTLVEKNHFVPYSPFEAEILSLNVKEGQSVISGQKLMSLSSSPSKIVVELSLDSASVGSVSVGDEVYIKLDSFPYQKHGLKKGEIVKIDNEVQDPEKNRSRPLSDRKFGFFAVVELTDLRSELTGKRLQLAPGMTVKAEILLDNRTLFSWIFGRP